MKNLFEEPYIEIVKYLSLDVIACSNEGEDPIIGDGNVTEDNEEL